MSTLLAAALRYAITEDWSVFPCRPRDKRPVTLQGFKDASTNPEQITQWWKANPAYNIGIALEASGLIVLDIDGPEGWAPFESLDLPQTRLVSTGRGEGGAHFYYRIPPGTRTPTASLAPKLDLRGAGAYVIAPPSIHPSGATYQSDAQPVHELTPDELERIRPPQPPKPVYAKPRDPSTDPLRGIDPPAYVWLLTGQQVDRTGKTPCPLPDHSDWDGDGGSFHAYSDADLGWYCYGCNRGGDIYNLAKLLWGDEPFPDLRRRIATALLAGGNA